MKTPVIIRYFVLAAAGTLLVAACVSHKGAPDPAAIEEQIARSKAAEIELVRSTVADPVRTETVLELLAERDRLLERVASDVGEHRDRMFALNARYDAERSDFEVLLADYNETRAAAQEELVDLIARMKQATTADEWKAISAFQVKRMNARDLSYRELAGGG